MSERQVSERGLVMSKIAFLGPGQMGTPMATRLLQAGHHVTVWDRTHGRATPLVERGADAAPVWGPHPEGMPTQEGGAT